jgi:hypothetical protein
MRSKKTSGNVICLLTEFSKIKWSHCIHLAEKMGVKKNERKRYLFAHKKTKSQNDVRASPRRSKTVQKRHKKNERFSFWKLPDHICFKTWKNTKKSADARFFRSIFSFFSLFWKLKNSKKIKKIPIFSFFSYALRRFFPKNIVTYFDNIADKFIFFKKCKKT